MPYLGAIVITIVLGLSFIHEEDAWEELNDMYLMDISDFDE